MGLSATIRLVSSDAQALSVTFETSWFPEKPPELHPVLLTETEFQQFQKAACAKPFGPSKEHTISLESLSQNEVGFECCLRISSAGSRTRFQFPVSANTHATLKSVMDSNIISEGYIGV